MTDLPVPALLRASHIKPWADRKIDAERLDVYNGILLASHLEASFDRGFITVGDEGVVIVSDALDDEARAARAGHTGRVQGLADAYRGYLPWHRERVFNGHLPRCRTRTGHP